MSQVVEFKRAIIDRSPEYEGHRKQWHSRCGRYRITWRDKAHGVDLPPEFIAESVIDEGDRQRTEIISRHRKLGPAMQACADHASGKSKRQAGVNDMASRRPRRRGTV